MDIENMMKVLIVVTDCNIGGITSSAYNLCDELSNRGITVDFLDMSNSGAAINNLSKEVTVKRLDGRSSYWRITMSNLSDVHGVKRLFLFVLGAIKKITNRSTLWNRIIFKKDSTPYDVSIAFRQDQACYFYVLNRTNAKKKLGFVHGDIGIIGKRAASFDMYLPQFDKVAFVSDAVRNGFVEKYPILHSNSCVIYNMFNAEKIHKLSLEQVDDLRTASFNIVTVTRIHNYQKQSHWIPEICWQLKNKGIDDFSWTVVGDGPQLKDDVALASKLDVLDVLQYVGGKDNPYPYIKAADLMVLTSKLEAYGMVVIESLILGKPIISSYYPALTEMIQDGKHGIIAGQTIDEVSECIAKYIFNENNVRKNCECFLKHEYMYSNDNAFSQFMEAISDVNEQDEKKCD